MWFHFSADGRTKRPLHDKPIRFFRLLEGAPRRPQFELRRIFLIRPRFTPVRRPSKAPLSGRWGDAGQQVRKIDPPSLHAWRETMLPRVLPPGSHRSAPTRLLVQQTPDATETELADALARHHSIAVSRQTMGRALHQLELTRKKLFTRRSATPNEPGRSLFRCFKTGKLVLFDNLAAHEVAGGRGVIEATGPDRCSSLSGVRSRFGRGILAASLSARAPDPGRVTATSALSPERLVAGSRGARQVISSRREARMDTWRVASTIGASACIALAVSSGPARSGLPVP